MQDALTSTWDACVSAVAWGSSSRSECQHLIAMVTQACGKGLLIGATYQVVFVSMSPATVQLSTRSTPLVPEGMQVAAAENKRPKHTV
jgi:hypothetical protein